MPVYISERLTKHDVHFKQSAEELTLFVSTSPPFLYLMQNGKQSYHILNSIQDINGLEDIAKVTWMDNYPLAPDKNNWQCSTVIVKLSSKLLSLRMRDLKRDSNVLSPVEENIEPKNSKNFHPHRRRMLISEQWLNTWVLYLLMFPFLNVLESQKK